MIYYNIIMKIIVLGFIFFRLRWERKRIPSLSFLKKQLRPDDEELSRVEKICLINRERISTMVWVCLIFLCYMVFNLIFGEEILIDEEMMLSNKDVLSMVCSFFAIFMLLINIAKSIGIKNLIYTSNIYNRSRDYYFNDGWSLEAGLSELKGIFDEEQIKSCKRAYEIRDNIIVFSLYLEMVATIFFCIVL